MKTMKTTTLLTSSLALLSSVHATSILSDSFNAADGTELRNYGSWSGGGANFQIKDFTWSDWTGYDNASAADKSVQDLTGNRFAVQSSIDLSGSGVTNPSGQTYYFSFMFTNPTGALDNPDPLTNDATQGWANLVFGQSGASPNSNQVNTLFTQYSGGNQQLATNEWGGGFSNVTNDGKQNLFIGRIDIAADGNATPDGDNLNFTSYGSVFQDGADVSTLFTNIANAGSDFGFQQTGGGSIVDTAVMDTFTIRLAQDSVIGNIRLGTELSDVGVVPEPSSYALLAGVVALGAMTLRRRR